MRVVKSLPSVLDYLAGDFSLNPKPKQVCTKPVYNRVSGDDSVFIRTGTDGATAYGRFNLEGKFEVFTRKETRSFLDGWRMKTRVLKVA